MMTFKMVKSAQAWDDFVTSQPSANFLQAWAWGDMQVNNQTVFRRGGYQAKQLVAVYVARLENARRARHLTIAGGPLLDWSKPALVKATLADIKQLAQQTGAVFVRLRPQLEASPQTLKLFKSLNLVRSPMHLSVEQAGILDLRMSDEAISAGMSQSLRRKLRSAQQAGVEVAATSSLSAAKTFCQIHHQHARQQGYTAFHSQFLLEQFKAFAKYKQVVIYTAKDQGELLAMNMIFFYGSEAAYHYGVSTPLAARLSAAPLLHLAAIEEARQRSLSRYNFWGIVPADQPGHRFYGVSQFKRSFGIEELNYLPAHDLVLKPMSYGFNWLIETVRRRRRRLLR